MSVRERVGSPRANPTHAPEHLTHTALFLTIFSCFQKFTQISHSLAHLSSVARFTPLEQRVIYSPIHDIGNPLVPLINVFSYIPLIIANFTSVPKWHIQTSNQGLLRCIKLEFSYFRFWNI